MRRLKNATIVLFMGLVTLFAVVGCTEEQIKQVDRTVADANDIVAGVAALLETPPARAFIPPDIQLYGAAAIAMTSIVFNGWQKIKGNLMKKTTKAIVRGIEVADKPKSNPMSAVKKSIETQMKLSGVLDKGNKLVDQLKVAR